MTADWATKCQPEFNGEDDEDGEDREDSEPRRQGREDGTG